MLQWVRESRVGLCYPHAPLCVCVFLLLLQSLRIHRMFALCSALLTRPSVQVLQVEDRNKKAKRKIQDWLEGEREEGREEIERKENE